MDLANNIINCFDKMTYAVNRYGIELKGYHDGVLDRVSKIDSVLIQKEIDLINSYCEIINEVPVGIDPITEPQINRNYRHINSFLKKFRLQLQNPDFLNLINDGDVIEIYALNHQQLFRSVEFFDFCDYDLETMTFVPWMYLFERSDSIQAKIFEVLNNVTQNKIGILSAPQIPRHLLRENYNGMNFIFEYHMKHCGCVIDEKDKFPMGYITIIQVNRIEDESKIAILNS